MTDVVGFKRPPSWLLTTPQGIPQVARACTVSWPEKPFHLECERLAVPSPWLLDFQHCMCSQLSPNVGSDHLIVLYLGPVPMLA